MAAPSEITAAVSGVFGLIDRLELYVNRYYARKDLIESNVELHSLLQEEHKKALELIHALEQSSYVDNVRLCHSIMQTRLGMMKSLLHANSEKLQRLNRDICKAGVMDRVRRTREVLEECQKGVTEFQRLLIDTVIPSLRHNTREEEISSDSYLSHSNVPLNPPRLTLDYNSTDTCEGQLKCAILEGSKSGIVGVMASGQGGVGKTCALRGLARDTEITQRFTGGVLYIKLGNNASIFDVINEIVRAVEWTGGDRLARTIRSLTTLQEVTDKAARWFKPHISLFLIDDIWWVNGITSNVFTLLGSMLHNESLLVYTTRDKRFLRGAHKRVLFQARQARGVLAQRMLKTHAGFASNVELSSTNKEAFNGILDICNGLPLGLGIAGATVLKYCENRQVNKQNAWDDYYHDLKSKEESIVMESAEQYGPLRLIVDSSLKVLESEKGFKKTFQELFRALCVLQKQQSISGQALQKVWGLDEIRDARMVAELFDEVSIVRLTRERGNAFCIQLHDLVLDIAMRKASERHEVKACFSRLVDNYRPKEQTTSADAEIKANKENPSSARKMRMGMATVFKMCFFGNTEDEDPITAEKEGKALYTQWWNVRHDGFIHENLSRVLKGAGKSEELFWLLGRAQWIVMRLQQNGIHGVEQDLRIGEQMAKTKTTDQTEFIRYLRLVGSASRMSCVAVANNAYEAWFLMYGRLARHTKSRERIQGFTSEITEHAPRPWIKPSIGFLEDAGGAALETIHIESSVKVLCISHGGSSDGNVRILWNDEHGVGYVTEYDKAYACQETQRLRLNELHKNSGGGYRTCKNWLSPTERCTFGAFSDNSEKLVCGYAEGRIYLWDLGPECKLEKCFKSPEAVTCLGISGDGTTIVSGSWCGSARVWDANSHEAVGILLEGLEVNRPVRKVAVSFDGNRIACTSDRLLKGDVHIWDREIGGIIALPPKMQHDDVSCVAISKDGRRVVSGSSDGIIRIWDIGDTEGSVLTINGHTGKVGCLAFSGDERRIISGSSYEGFRVWDAETGQKIGNSLESPGKHGEAVAVSANGNEVVTALSDDTLRVWNVDNIDALDHPECFTNRVHSVAYCGDGKRVVSGSKDGCVRVWDVESGEMIGKPMKGYERTVDFVRVSRNGSRILSGSRDGSACVWDANNGELVGRVLPRLEITSEGIDDDGKRVVFASRAGVHVWDVESGGLALHVAGDTSFAACVGIRSDGTRIAFSSRYKSVILWDVDEREAVGRPLEGHTKDLCSLAWSGDGTRVVSGSEDCTVRVWNVVNGNAIGEPFVHSCGVVHVQSDADCSHVVSYDKNGYGRLWDVSRGQCVRTSSDAVWSSTLHRHGLAPFHRRMQGMRNTKIMGCVGAKHEQVLAYLNRKAVRVGDVYFSDMHGSTFWPFCRIMRQD